MNLARPPRSPRFPGVQATLVDLFDLLPDVVFFLKDAAGRYLAVNQTLVRRCGRQKKTDLLGRTVAELFPTRLAESYSAQDQRVLATGTPLNDKLEVHLYDDRREGWCVTHKWPLRDVEGRVVGLAGLSRDVQAAPAAPTIPRGVAEAVDALSTRPAEVGSVAALARIAGLSANAFGRQIKRLFHLTPQQLLHQTRLRLALEHLSETNDSMADIASSCGYYDQSAFSRHFRAATGLSPLAYRRHLRERRASG